MFSLHAGNLDLIVMRDDATSAISFLLSRYHIRSQCSTYRDFIRDLSIEMSVLSRSSASFWPWYITISPEVQPQHKPYAYVKTLRQLIVAKCKPVLANHVPGRQFSQRYNQHLATVTRRNLSKEMQETNTSVTNVSMI